jgi:hypothetical protein
MSDPFEITESKQTEYNANHFIILQIAQLNQLIQESLVQGEHSRAKILLRQYFTLIKPKLMQFNKSEQQQKIETIFRSLEMVGDNPSSYFYRKLQRLYDEIYYGADIVGMGMTTKQSQSSVANDI